MRIASHKVLPLDPSLAASERGARMELQRRFPDYPPFSKKCMVANLLRLTMLAEPYGSKRRMVARAETEWSGVPGAIVDYRQNVGHGRTVSKCMSDQRLAFRRDLFATYDAAKASLERAPVDPVEQRDRDARAEYDSQPVNPVPPPLPSPMPEAIRCQKCGSESKYVGDIVNGECGTCRTLPVKVEAPKVKGDPLRDYLQWSQFVREVCNKRNADGHPLDEWSMRPTLDGLSLIKAGLPAEAVKDAATMHFPLDAKREVNVSEFDFVAHGIDKYLEVGSKARVPMMMVGPKGTGKSTRAKLLAETLGLPFGMVSMTAGTSPSAFYGRPKVGGDGGVIESHFVKLYRDGGVYLFDEMDASDPNILLIVNAALANGHFANPSTGESIARHEDFIPLAAANTMGLGGGRDYTGRDRLDAATLDRWGAGRVRVNLDAALEASLAATIIGGE